MFMKKIYTKLRAFLAKEQDSQDRKKINRDFLISLPLEHEQVCWGVHPGLETAEQSGGSLTAHTRDRKGKEER